MNVSSLAFKSCVSKLIYLRLIYLLGIQYLIFFKFSSIGLPRQEIIRWVFIYRKRRYRSIPYLYEKKKKKTNIIKNYNQCQCYQLSFFNAKFSIFNFNLAGLLFKMQHLKENSKNFLISLTFKFFFFVQNISYLIVLNV